MSGNKVFHILVLIEEAGANVACNEHITDRSILKYQRN